jgi:ribonuclease G
MEGTRDEIEVRAVPFRAGEEVHVDIVEPHMYEVDDAVAKVDGYIISVVNGGPFVGSKRLVRIENAGRTAAIAVLVGEEAEQAAAAAEERKQARARSERAVRAARTRRKKAEVPEPAASGDAPATAGDDGPAPRGGRAGAAEDGAPARSGRRRGRRGRGAEPASTEAEAVEALADEGAPAAGTGPGALSEAEAEPGTPSEDNGAAGDGEDDVLQSSSRRRGRRGGRRRSRAKAPADAAEVPDASN